MTTPDVPHSVDLTVEVPGTPEQVWEAIATGNGLTSWMFATPDFEGEVGLHVEGEGGLSSTITAWEPPHRFAWQEGADWATNFGFTTEVTPMALEFLVEAQEGGSCVVRIVHGFHGTGADWEEDFIDGARGGWPIFLDNLRRYLAGFAGKTVTKLSASATIAGTPDEVLERLEASIGATEVGAPVTALGLTAQVGRMGPGDLLVEVTAPVEGYVTFHSWPGGDGSTRTGVDGFFFSEGAEAYVAAEQPAWDAWLEGLAPA